MKKILFHPFEHFTERSLILFGIASTILLSISGAFFNARFDGVLDLHFVLKTHFSDTLIDNVLNVSILSLALFTLGKIRNTKTRFIDLFATSLIARIPYYFVPFMNWNNTIYNESEQLLIQFSTLQPGQIPQFESTQMIILVGFAVTSMLLLAWFLYLLYSGYKVATNAKGGIEIILFSATILIAEISSKIIFYYLN